MKFWNLHVKHWVKDVWYFPHFPKALEAAIENLNEAKNYFAKVDCKEQIRDVVYFQARLYHTLGKTQERNRCAMLFRQLHQDLPFHGVPLINLL